MRSARRFRGANVRGPGVSATLVKPNLREAETLSGLRVRGSRDLGRTAARGAE
ncbi:MAG: hypothetical protein V3U03_08185 [Myxococcota bacterium]